jgi:hypothetical protein
MDDNLARAPLNQPPKALGYTGRLDFQKGGFNQDEAATFANPARGATNVFIGLGTPASMANDQYSRF